MTLGRVVGLAACAVVLAAMHGCAADDGGDTGASASTSGLTVGGHVCPQRGEIAVRTIPSDNRYYLTTFGGASDTQRMACGGTADASWFYLADSWRFGCGARVRMTDPRSGRWCVAQVADVGPNICVEQAAGRAVIDASPRVSSYLFHTTGVGWSDRLEIVAETVSGDTPLGCGTGTSTPATCSAGQVSCSGRCVDTASDSANCGSCGNACASGSTCTAGRCAASVSACSAATDCATCSGLYGLHGCGWCDGRCLPGTASGSSDRTCSGASWAWVPSACTTTPPPPPPPPPSDPCGSASDCGACAARSGCGWCGDHCASGTASGSSDGLCSGASWAWYPSDCTSAPPPPPADPCAVRSTCTDCAATAGCGWCVDQCMSGTSSGANSGSCSYYDWTWLPSYCL